MALEGNFNSAVISLVEDLVTADKVNINEAIFEESFAVGDFARAHTLVTGVRNGKVQPIVLAHDKYGAMPVGDETSCSLNSCDLTPNYAAKKWTLSEYNCRIPVCMRSFDDNFLLFWNQYRQGLEDPTTNPDAQAFLNYLTGIAKEQVLGTQWRVGYWGDTASAEPLISGNDGFFVQASAGSGEKIVKSTAGAEPTAKEIYEALQEAYEFAGQQVWGANEDVVFKMSYAAASKLVTWLNTMTDTSQYNCDCFNPDGIVAARRFSIDGLRVFGIPVEAHREIDLSMNAAGQTDPYKILLARKSNLLIGTNTQDKLDGFDIFYDKKDRTIYMDTLVQLGVMIPLDEYVYVTFTNA